MIQRCIDEESDGADFLIDSDDDVQDCSRRLFGKTLRHHEGMHGEDTLREDLQRSSLADEGWSDSDVLQEWTADEFEMEYLLGAGGFGIVFAVREIATHRRVAMKLLRPSIASSLRARRRFFREVSTVREIHDEGIVRPLAIGLLDGLPAILSELIEGPSLRVYLDSQGGKLPEIEAIELVAQVSKSLQFMHERGVLHRDLKPANILLQPIEEMGAPVRFVPKIADFGLAKQMDTESLSATMGEQGKKILGTLQYMAPEQVLGKQNAVSTLSDLYSLGAILYECVVGEVPYRGDSYVEILTRMLGSPPIPARQKNPELSREIHLILQRALSKEPENRYPSVAAFHEDLQNVLQGLPVNVSKPSSWRVLRGWVRQNPALASLTMVLFSFLILASLTFGVLYNRERQAVSNFRNLMNDALDGVRLQIAIAEDVLSKLPASAEERYKLHKRSLQTLHTVAEGLDYNTESKYRLSVGYSYLAQAADQTHRPEEADSYRRQCLQIIDALLVDDPHNSKYLYDQFYNRKGLADRPAKNDALMLQNQESLLPLIERLRELEPENVDYLDAEAAIFYRIGETRCLYNLLGGDEYLKKAIRSSQALYEANPNTLLFSKYAIAGRAVLADRARRDKNLREAEAVCREGIEFVESIHHPDKRDYWFLFIVREIYRSMAATQIAWKRWPESVACLEKCLEIDGQLQRYDPKAGLCIIGIPEFQAELLRARRKAGLKLEEESALRIEIQKNLDAWKASGFETTAMPKLLALLENDDAPPIEPGGSHNEPSRIWETSNDGY